jgi:segregation and condensation protein A
MSLQIQLQKFEGPLALLLYLIRKEEMDIFDIKIHEITKQYLEYIKLMKELDLELAGEFVAMAATLIQIKSRLLLPQYNEHGEVVETEDPRKELVQKLLDYQKFQEASKLLYERPLLGRDVWTRGVRETLFTEEDDIVIEENGLFSLIAAYRQTMKALKKRIHRVTAKAQSIASRILEIRDRLIVGTKVALMDLVESLEGEALRRQVLITFLSALELGKMGFVSLFQTEPYAPLYVEALKPVDGDIVNRVEEYDSMNAADIAANLMSQAQKIEDNDEFLLPDEKTEEDTEDLAMDGVELASDEEILAAELEMENVTMDAGESHG